jgi:alanyl-tRNA synthetase
VVAAVTVTNDRPLVIAAVNDLGQAWGLAAGDLVRVAAAILGGGGGGKSDVAQGGGKDPSRVDEALAAVEHQVGQRVTGGA